MANLPNATSNNRPSDEDDNLQLTLGPSVNAAIEQPPEVEPAPANSRRRLSLHQTASRSVKRRKDSGDAETIPPPYPWATDRPCKLHSLAELKRNGHVSVTGKVRCKKCDRCYEMAFDLEKRFCEIGCYFVKRKEEMRHRATAEWKSPTLPDCRFCGEKNAAVPEIAGSEKTNWLFLFLGVLIGCCKHQDLKYFLDKNNAHRTAAKDRLVYSVYLNIFKQLDPNGPFDL